MLDHQSKVLYVGKAGHLKKRLSSYFTAALSPKNHALVAQIAKIEITVTLTESEALLLENNLIKAHQPRYNILLRDDKSYPYLYLSDHPFPSLSLHRGPRRGKGRYFGPYPHPAAVHKSLSLLQKLFPLRQCQDSFFHNRSRPCLQYQIKRCTAPCVGLIDQVSYQEDVQHTVFFLEGKSQVIINRLVEKMQTASQALEYEKAARYRDQIGQLRKLQEHPYVRGGHLDIVVGLIQKDLACVQVMTVRDGLPLGSRAFFPQHPPEIEVATLLSAFLPQYYLTAQRDIPHEIVVNETIEALLTQVISQQCGRPVRIHSRVRGVRARWVAMALENAKATLAQRQSSQYRQRLAALSLILNMETLPQRIECFDVSHSLGEAMVAACVVFNSEGACKQAYRHFNITQVPPGDDYAALCQALTRHYRKVTVLPDLLLIDGGLGQVKVAQQVLGELQLAPILIIGIAKGVERRAGLETLILAEQKVRLPKDSPALHLLQQIRDEAHRFAITAHRKQRIKLKHTSILEQIEGIGTKRRQQLLTHFGGLHRVSKAGLEDLVKVPGISRQLAQKIYEFFL